MEQTQGGRAPWIMEVAVGHRLWRIAQADEPLDLLPPSFLAASSHKEALHESKGFSGTRATAARSKASRVKPPAVALDLAHVPAVEGGRMAAARRRLAEHRDEKKPAQKRTGFADLGMAACAAIPEPLGIRASAKT